MEKIQSLQELQEYLKLGQILYIIQEKGLVYFFLKKDKIQVHGDYARYVLSWPDFIKTFQGEDFYLYERKEEFTVSKEKDEEYYNWSHK